MDIYNFNPETGVFLGKSQADPDPLDAGNFLLPAFSTSIEPPDDVAGFDRVFSEGEWRYVSQIEPTPEPVVTPVISKNLVRVEAGRRLELLARPYVAAERETWPTQMKEAEALSVNPAASAPLLSRRAAARSMAVADYAANVLAKEALFSAASGDILAAQDRLLALSPIPANYDDDAYWP